MKNNTFTTLKLKRNWDFIVSSSLLVVVGDRRGLGCSFFNPFEYFFSSPVLKY